MEINVFPFILVVVSILVEIESFGLMWKAVFVANACIKVSKFASDSFFQVQI